jgi:hypothetical protein
MEPTSAQSPFPQALHSAQPELQLEQPVPQLEQQEL